MKRTAIIMIMTAILAIVSTGCGSQKQNVEPTVSGGTYQGSSQNRLASMAKYGDWRTLDAQPLEPGTERLVEDWAQYYLERPIRSLRLLD